MSKSMGGAVQPIIRYGTEALHRPCATVSAFDDTLDTLIDTMFATMYAAQGVGLAANQIGVDARVFVISCPDLESGEFTTAHVVNPVLQLPPLPHDLEVRSEGCLSVPDVSAELVRSRTATVTGWDRMGRPIRVEGSGLVARCLQHECDHLDGLTYLDRLPRNDQRGIIGPPGYLYGRAPSHPTPSRDTTPPRAPQRGGLQAPR